MDIFLGFCVKIETYRFEFMLSFESIAGWLDSLSVEADLVQIPCTLISYKSGETSNILDSCGSLADAIREYGWLAL